ncbi:MAG: cytochrome C' [Burkholderiales bacterium]
MKALLLAVAATFAVPGVAWAADPNALLDKYRCNVCHAEREPLAGPSYAAIADHYRHQKQAYAVVAAKIRTGAHGGGLWNMPPHPEVSRVDAEAMARAILAVR